MQAFTVTQTDCQGDIHPAAIRGIQLFNRGAYWEAHEELETAWVEENGSVRNLYRAILQTAVIYLHVSRSNFPGALKVYQRVQKWMRPWPPVCRGIEVGGLRRDLQTVMEAVQRLGPGRIDDFDRSLLKQVRWK
jgi:predicted metal-dependent hydrolase